MPTNRHVLACFVTYKQSGELVPQLVASNVTGQIQGTGVGLASVAHILKQHGGTIAVESAEGHGDTVPHPIALCHGSLSRSIPPKPSAISSSARPEPASAPTTAELGSIRPDPAGHPCKPALLSPDLQCSHHKHFGTSKVHATRHIFAHKMDEAGVESRRI